MPENNSSSNYTGKYESCNIGSGPGGYAAAFRLADLGFKLHSLSALTWVVFVLMWLNLQKHYCIWRRCAMRFLP